MSLSKQVQAIVIRVYPSGESDTILRLITPEFGKISAIAKYAKKSRKRYGTSFDLLDCGIFEIREGRGSLASVAGFVENLSFRNIRSNLWRLSCSAVLCEVSDYLLPEHSGSEENSYKMIIETFSTMDSKLDHKDILKALFNGVHHLLILSGFLEMDQEFTPSAKNL